MTKRFSSRERKEVNRKARKARWIRAKNLMRMYPDCAHGGDFYCNHVSDPAHPWVWVDFRFFHTRLKRYFSVAMVTAEYEAYCKIEEASYNAACFPEADFVLRKAELHPVFGLMHELEEPAAQYQQEYEAAVQRQQAINEVELYKPFKVSPGFKIMDYGPVAVGVSATVNKPFIDEQVIRTFIQLYRDLGEPITPGLKWYGEEVEVTPSNLIKRGA